MTPLTFAVIKYVLIACIWLFAWLAVHSLRKDVKAFLPPRKSKKRQNRMFQRSKEQILVGNGSKVEASNPPFPQGSSTSRANPNNLRKSLRGKDGFFDQELSQLDAGTVESGDTGALASLVAATETREKERRRPSDTIPTLFVIIDGPRAGFTLNLTNQPITIGRDPSNTVVLDDEFISARHARLYPDPSNHTWTLEDLGSTNGTYIDGKRISHSLPLSVLTPVRVGATTFELK